MIHVIAEKYSNYPRRLPERPRRGTRARKEFDRLFDFHDQAEKWEKTLLQKGQSKTWLLYRTVPTRSAQHLVIAAERIRNGSSLVNVSFFFSSFREEQALNPSLLAQVHDPALQCTHLCDVDADPEPWGNVREDFLVSRTSNFSRS